MDVVPSISSNQVQQASQLYALKQASRQQGESVLQLLHSVAPAQTSANPPHLGQTVDVKV